MGKAVHLMEVHNSHVIAAYSWYQDPDRHHHDRVSPFSRYYQVQFTMSQDKKSPATQNPAIHEHTSCYPSGRLTQWPVLTCWSSFAGVTRSWKTHERGEFLFCFLDYAFFKFHEKSKTWLGFILVWRWRYTCATRLVASSFKHFGCSKVDRPAGKFFWGRRFRSCGHLLQQRCSSFSFIFNPSACETSIQFHGECQILIRSSVAKPAQWLRKSLMS